MISKKIVDLFKKYKKVHLVTKDGVAEIIYHNVSMLLHENEICICFAGEDLETSTCTMLPYKNIINIKESTENDLIELTL